MARSTVVFQKIMKRIRETQRQERTERGDGSFIEKERGLEEVMDLVQEYGDERAREEIENLF